MFTMENARGIVRPVVTFGLVAAQVALAGAWALGLDDAEQAFAGLSPFTGIIVAFWFKSREGEGRGESARTTTVTTTGENPPPPVTG